MVMSSKICALIEYLRGVIMDHKRIFGREPRDDEVLVEFNYAEIKQLIQALEVEADGNNI